MRNLTVMVCSVLFAGLAWAQPSPVAEQTPATPEAMKAEIEALKASKPAAGVDVFGNDKVWQFHFTLTAAEYAAMQPAPGIFTGGPGRFPGGPMPPPKAEPKSGEPQRDAHRSAFGI